MKPHKSNFTLENADKFFIYRQEVKDALERAFVPVIAAVAAFIDCNCNLQLLKEAGKNIEELWRNIFEVCDTEGLTFDTITKGASSVTNAVLPQFIICLIDNYQV